MKIETIEWWINRLYPLRHDPTIGSVIPVPYGKKAYLKFWIRTRRERYISDYQAIKL